MQIDNLIPIAEYADRIGLTANAIRRRCIRGTLPGVKMGRDFGRAQRPSPTIFESFFAVPRCRWSQNTPPDGCNRTPPAAWVSFFVVPSPYPSTRWNVSSSGSNRHSSMRAPRSVPS